MIICHAVNKNFMFFLETYCRLCLIVFIILSSYLLTFCFGTVWEIKLATCSFLAHIVHLTVNNDILTMIL